MIYLHSTCVFELVYFISYLQHFLRLLKRRAETENIHCLDVNHARKYLLAWTLIEHIKR